MQNMAEFRNEQADRSNNICCRSLISTRNGSDEEERGCGRDLELGDFDEALGPSWKFGEPEPGTLGLAADAASGDSNRGSHAAQGH